MFSDEKRSHLCAACSVDLPPYKGICCFNCNKISCNDCKISCENCNISYCSYKCGSFIYYDEMQFCSFCKNQYKL